jgi:O-antigen/teichoic acid export membrane protein
MIGRALFEARLPDIGTQFGQGRIEDGLKVIKITSAVAILMVLGAYTLLWILFFNVDLPIPSEYRPSPAILLIALAANLFDCAYLAGIQTLQALKKTSVQGAATVVSGITTVFLSYWLVSRFADKGLMASLAIGLGVQAISSMLAAQYLAKSALAERTLPISNSSQAVAPDESL